MGSHQQVMQQLGCDDLHELVDRKFLQELGLGFLGRWLDRLAIGKVVANAVRDSTIAQKIYYETGKAVTPEMLQKAKADLDTA